MIVDVSRRPGLCNWNALREGRQGVALHYDGSLSDTGAIAYMMRDPKCKVSYNWEALDEGTIIDIAPWNARAWAMGECRPSDRRFTYRDANSAFYSIALAAKPGDVVKPAQAKSVIELVRAIFRFHRWTADDIWRLTDHAREAWPRGRKVDLEDLVLGPRLVGFDLAIARLMLLDRLSPSPASKVAA